MFIDSHSLDDDSERRLRRYGTVYKIGIDDFAGKIKDIKNTYSPVVYGPEEKIYTGFYTDIIIDIIRQNQQQKMRLNFFKGRIFGRDILSINNECSNIYKAKSRRCDKV